MNPRWKSKFRERMRSIEQRRPPRNGEIAISRRTSPLGASIENILRPLTRSFALVGEARFAWN